MVPKIVASDRHTCSTGDPDKTVGEGPTLSRGGPCARVGDLPLRAAVRITKRRASAEMPSRFGSIIESWGIVTESWGDEWHMLQVGEEVELQPIAWRTPDARWRMTEPPEDGWLPGEIAYGGGRVIAILDSTRLDRHMKSMWPSNLAEHAGDTVSTTIDSDAALASKPLTVAAVAGDPLARFALMVGYAHAFKAHGRVVKRDDALTVIRQIIHCTTRQAETAFEALPYPELRNPPPTAREGAELGTTAGATGGVTP
jgi:hypothetical protein